MKRAAMIVAVVLLGACNAETADENSGVTAEEAADLNETEAMLDAPMGNEMPMDDLGADTGDVLVTDEPPANAE